MRYTSMVTIAAMTSLLALPVQAQGIENGPTKWTGKNDGVTNTMDLIPAGPGRYSVSMGGGVRGCSMEFKGDAVQRGQTLMVRQGSEADRGNMCHLDIAVNGNVATVKELGCITYHGSHCDFSGRLQRVSVGSASRPTMASAFPIGSQCPAMEAGHRLLRDGGSTLFDGDPSKRMSLAPDGSSGGVNRWQVSGASSTNLQCHYEGGATTVYSLPPTAKTCRQQPGASITCN